MTEQSPSNSIWVKAAAFFGFLSFFNIVEHSQSIIDFSASFVLIAEWWRYLTSYIFLPLPYQLPQLEKDILTIVLLVLPVAYRFGFEGRWFDLRTHGRFISKIWDFAEDMDAYPTGVTFAIVATCVISIAYGFATGMRLIEALSEQTFGILAIALALFCLLNVRLRGDQPEDYESNWRDTLLLLVFCLTFPIATMPLVTLVVCVSLITIIQFRAAIYRIVFLWICVLIAAWISGIYLDEHIEPILRDWPRAPSPVA